MRLYQKIKYSKGFWSIHKITTHSIYLVFYLINLIAIFNTEKEGIDFITKNI